MGGVAHESAMAAPDLLQAVLNLLAGTSDEHKCVSGGRQEGQTPLLLPPRGRHSARKGGPVG